MEIDYILGTQLAIISIQGPCPARFIKKYKEDKNATVLSCVLVNRDVFLNLLFTILITSLQLRYNTDFDILSHLFCSVHLYKN